MLKQELKAASIVEKDLKETTIRLIMVALLSFFLFSFQSTVAFVTINTTGLKVEKIRPL